MPKDKLTDYSATNASNTDVGGVNIDEGMLPSAVNNALRELLTHLKEFSDGTSGIDVLSLADDDASAAMKLQAPASVTSDTTLTLPDGDGDSGQTLVTNGSGTLAWAAPYGNRNLIINGAMQVAQRGTSAASLTTSGYRTVDRFNVQITSAGTWTSSQSTDVPSGEGFSNSLKFDCTTANASLGASSSLRLQQKLEGQDLQQLSYGTSSAKSVTFSFWVKSNKTGTYVLDLQNADNSRISCATYTISAADTWEKKVVTLAGDTSQGFDNDNAASLFVTWWLAAGSNFTSGTQATVWEAQDNTNRAVSQTVNLADTIGNDFYITGVQLEVGEQATPFEHRSFGDELARCQRYFYRIGGNETTAAGSNIGRIASGVMFGTTSAQLIRSNFVTMRDAPNVTFDDAVANYTVTTSRTTNAVASIDTNQSTASTMSVSVTCGATSNDGDGAVLRSTGADSTVSVDAEL